jgi:tyrosinase
MFDRRALLLGGGTALAMLGAGVHVAAQNATVVRRSIREMSADDPDLAAMRRAVAAMKALPASDPRNWTRFAEIHGSFCPHGNWYFLPWHRAYILAFERLCRELSGKPDFALPYWNWTVDRRFPAAFAAGTPATNPLNHPRTGVARGWRLTDDMVGPQVMARIMNSPDFEAFGSTRPPGQDSAAPRWQRRAGSKTELEFNPHDSVHLSVGGNMGIVELSSFDPVFYLHHANVDRLWNAWNRRGNANSPERIWRDFAFNGQFIGPDAAPWNVAVGQLGETQALGYRYDDDDGPFAADVALPMGDDLGERLRAYRRYGASLLACADGGIGEIPLPSGGTIQLASARNRAVATRDRPLAVTVPLARPLGEIANAAALTLRPDRAAALRDRRHVWAVIRGIAPPPDRSTRVHVFCNCRTLTPATPLTHPSYATSFSFFAARGGGRYGAHAGHGAGVSVCVDLTPAVARMQMPRHGRGAELAVQLLPACNNRDPAASAVRPDCVEIVVL